MKEKKTGINLSKIIAGTMGWGTWGKNMSSQQVDKYIQKCIEIGVTTFDHADIYGDYTTEELFGKALDHKSLRDKIQLITKCGIKLVTPNRPEHRIKSYDTSASHIIKSVENSLKALQTDYIDILLIHRPSPLMNPEEIAETFTRLFQEGKVRHFGVSNFTPSQFDMLNKFYPLITNQIKISPLELTPFIDGTLDQMVTHKVKPMGYATLGGGAFFKKDCSKQIERIKTVVKELSEKYYCSVDQILTAWILKHPSQISPIIGTTNIDRMELAVKAIDIKLTDEEWFQIWEASTDREVA